MQTEQHAKKIGNTHILKPRKALNKAFLKVKPNRSQIEEFKENLIQLLDRTNDTESEEFHKNLVTNFLNRTYYESKHFINTKGRNDLVIHNGNKAKSSVGVILEAKKPTNRAEMLSREKINVKAFQELVLYYLRERITHKNLEVKYVIATNIHEWFIFDANVFEKAFAQNKKLVSQFTDFEAGRLTGTNTDYFYKEIAQPFIAEMQQEVEFTYFDIRNYEKPLRNNNPKDDNKLIALYKLLSPEHLLKLPFTNDSNSLDKRFYGELLHIIGLTETKQGGKKLIERQKEGQRNTGSFLENAIIQLDSMDKIGRLENPTQFGANQQERLFNVGLELSITWLNRILFLKLLEAQLITYHKGDRSYEFLSLDRINNYDDLNSLFFQVLARQYSERNEDVKALFEKVPYLNSSLFEPTDIEHSTLFISNLRDDKTLPIYSATVLKDKKGKKRSGELNALEYLFEFLNAYDFSSEGGETIQEDNKTLINASVLGLIFEKINGYKDGSFFTPGFITMYMCRETIRKAVVQKFNENKDWDCKDLDELYDRIEDRKEANELINSLKICDPAVGSGHFLVSALNEMIAIKNDLNILQDRSGRRLKEYQVEVVNDELIVTDEDGELFEYNPTAKESQRIQEALFHEKQKIIENCLFGVDINPNSVKICRLRLWIELLKNAYYKNETELETLPNIDINIKCGNSLISRFDLDADLSKALKDSKWNIDSYRNAVDTYRNAQNKEQKREMEKIIQDIKSDFRSEISANDPKVKKLQKVKGELFIMSNQTQMFELSKSEKAAWNKKLQKLTKDSKKLETEIQEIIDNKIYENAFEWRFEFPEVLDKNGDYIGFDVVIGNPPYMRVQEITKTQPLEKNFYEQNYQVARSSYDLANIFMELAVNISNVKSSNCYILPHKFFNSSSTSNFRDYLTDGQYIDKLTHFGANMIFDEADTYTCIANFSPLPNSGFLLYKAKYNEDYHSKMLDEYNYDLILYQQLNELSELYGSNQWILPEGRLGVRIFEKLYKSGITFSDRFEGIYQGIATSKDELYIGELLEETEQTYVLTFEKLNKQYEVEKDFFKPLLRGKDVQRYSYLKTDLFVFFPYDLSTEGEPAVTLNKFEEGYPLTFKYIIDNEINFKSRERGRAGKMDLWYTYIYPKNLDKFQKYKLSSMEICSRYPNVTLNPGIYHNTKVYSWIKKETTKESYEYLLSIANSKILWWFLIITGDTLRGDARTFKTNYLNPFPLPGAVSIEKEQEITEKVKTLIEIKKQNPTADTAVLEAEIDRLVYELYGLTEEEIGIVENSINN
ncbi:Eco57I restriction-modification methylase domain-containing protein [Salegentibacter sp. LM13S]|uniref:DUF7149 domain-containing protein n=1 Tax=Salegentibacter lacus TaxID=2873599 RepID=UPI001CCEBC17|nr:Eco57I restriction-modification methylase domain-containing protein [Salegentibacter lacus]MBZ9629799.1 Eco57I restriction-modification methylase domain-containing protein [Salegentibacter lacus]